MQDDLWTTHEWFLRQREFRRRRLARKREKYRMQVAIWLIPLVTLAVIVSVSAILLRHPPNKAYPRPDVHQVIHAQPGKV